MSIASAVMAGFVESGYAETVTYRPRAGDTRAGLSAIVDRRGRQPNARAAVPTMMVTLINDVTNGISTSEVDTGGDKIDVSEYHGGSATTRQIQRVVGERTDKDWITVEVA